MKLKSTDLMIKDWIFSHETQSYQQITSISEENVTINAVTFDYPTYEEIELIPLTPELLEKCGFENNFGNHTLILSNGGIISIYLSDDSWGIYSSKDSFRFGNSYSNNNKINYLHELQQLVRILTKQELIINL